MSEATARVLDVGNCDPDHAMIRRMLTDHFSVEVDRVMFVREALERMRQQRYDLVLVNRLIFEDGSEGIELVRKARAEHELQGVPIMMISNLEEAQRACVAAGGVGGFGKAALNSATTLENLARYLPRR